MFKTYLLDCIPKGTDLETDWRAYMLIEEFCNGIFNLFTEKKKKKKSGGTEIEYHWWTENARKIIWDKKNFMSQASKTQIYMLSISIILICFWKKFHKMTA